MRIVVVYCMHLQQLSNIRKRGHLKRGKKGMSLPPSHIVEQKIKGRTKIGVASLKVNVLYHTTPRERLHIIVYLGI